ncbi:MAG: UvrD-helicase domain-containing protein [Vicinamibacteria bacterium]|nr:UvrD-helicase domain-containing protein [Vicinamibacteria bacterium]
MSVFPIDEPARAKARGDFSASLVLASGAGTGKTTLIVDRIETLVRLGKARLDEIVAVTFTENAATTIKLRLRGRLERARADESLSRSERERAAHALSVLERAPVSTIHSLCAAILAERPLECGAPIGFRVAEEAEADLIFESAWTEWLAAGLTAGDDALLAALDAGIPLEGEGAFGERSSLRGFARALVEQRDLEPLTAASRLDPRAWREELEEQAARAQKLRSMTGAGDALAAALDGLVGLARRANELDGHELQAHLQSMPVIRKNLGQISRWTSREALQEARRIAEWTKEAKARWESQVGAALHSRLTRALIQVVELYERKKTEQGVLDFLDLLLKARDALRRRESLRRYFRERYRHVIIDEFQDTDPLQLEIAEILTEGEPGKLCVVGDAMQSIYRFRRADAVVFVRLAEKARAAPGFGVAHLTQNFRSRPAILRFVNRAFARLIEASNENGQPVFEAIAPRPDLAEGAAVLALRFDVGPVESADLLRAEAAALAAMLGRIAAGELPVRDPANGESRGSRAGDVMILSRRLTQLRYLEEALEAADLRYVIEGGKSFFDRQEVHETLATLRAVDDPNDRVALVAALRSSFFGASDRDIALYALSGGALRAGSIDAGLPGAGALGPAFDLVQRLHRERRSMSVPSLIERLYDETRVLASHATTSRGAAAVANLEKVVVLARQAQDLGVLTLRGFIDLLARRIAETSEEPDLPAARPGALDTIRIMSIHKAKGLESPIVALHDTADEFWSVHDVVPLREEGKIAVGFRAGCQPPNWAELKKREQARAWAEGRRLLYVACTRPRDWLAIPQPSASAKVGSFLKDLIALLPHESDGDVRVVGAGTIVTDAAPAATVLLAEGEAEEETADAAGEQWEQDRKRLIERSASLSYAPIAATRLASATAPAAAISASTPEGRELGTLVHRILEWTPLATPERERLQAISEALASRLGLSRDFGRRAADSVMRVLAHPVLERARRAVAVWRELPVWLPDEGRLVEGVVDLVFQEDLALVIVDYKSDPIREDDAVAQAAHHAPQLRLYDRALTLATGMPVKERLVLFTEIGRAVSVD